MPRNPSEELALRIPPVSSSPDGQGILTLDSRDDVGHLPDRNDKTEDVSLEVKRQGLETGFDVKIYMYVYVYIRIHYVFTVCIYI